MRVNEGEPNSFYFGMAPNFFRPRGDRAPSFARRKELTVAMTRVAQGVTLILAQGADRVNPAGATGRSKTCQECGKYQKGNRNDEGG
jgi:hypothetical protein